MWELAASTLGAPGASIEDLIPVLTTAGVRQIELRTAPDAIASIDMTAPARSALLRRFGDAGISVLAVTSNIRIAADGSRGERAVEDLHRHIALATDLGARFVRVFPGAPATETTPDLVPQIVGARGDAEARAADRLAALVTPATDTGVWPLLETHDSHPRGTDTARILRRLDETAPGHRVGAIWDILHPWRTGEPMNVTWPVLEPYIRDGRGYVQIKDVGSRRDTTPVLQGSGVVPLRNALDLLRASGYHDVLSLEWERTWYPHVPPLADALASARAALDAIG